MERNAAQEAIRAAQLIELEKKIASLVNLNQGLSERNSKLKEREFKLSKTISDYEQVHQSALQQQQIFLQQQASIPLANNNNNINISNYTSNNNTSSDTGLSRATKQIGTQKRKTLADPNSSAIIDCSAAIARVHDDSESASAIGGTSSQPSMQIASVIKKKRVCFNEEVSDQTTADTILNENENSFSAATMWSNCNNAENIAPEISMRLDAGEQAGDLFN